MSCLACQGGQAWSPSEVRAPPPTSPPLQRAGPFVQPFVLLDRLLEAEGVAVVEGRSQGASEEVLIDGPVPGAAVAASDPGIHQQVAGPDVEGRLIRQQRRVDRRTNGLKGSANRVDGVPVVSAAKLRVERRVNTCK